jgi:membrane protease subunit HflK
VIVALVLACGWPSGFYIVVEGTRGVVLTFGKFSKETTSGLNWRLPWPIQSHEIVNLSQVRTLEVGYRNNVRTKVLKESLMLTDDENIVDLQFAVQYLVKDAQAFTFNVRRPDESAMQIAENGDARGDRQEPHGRDPVRDAGRRRQQGAGSHAADPRPLQHRHPGEHGHDPERAAARAGAGGVRRRGEGRPGPRAAEERGQAYANDVDPRARGAASRLFQEADGYKQRVIATAEGDASRFRQVLTEYAKAPQVTRERIYIETMQRDPVRDQQDHDGLPRLREPALCCRSRSCMQQRAGGADGRARTAPPASAPRRARARARARRCATATGRSDESRRPAIAILILVALLVSARCTPSTSASTPSCSSWAR